MKNRKTEVSINWKIVKPKHREIEKKKMKMSGNQKFEKRKFEKLKIGKLRNRKIEKSRKN